MAAALDQQRLEAIAGRPAVDSASITPPQSANGKKDVPEGVPSELSDLELDPKKDPVPDETPIKQEEEDDDDEDIEPDHYYGGGKIPVFKPVSAMWRLYFDGMEADRAMQLDHGAVQGLQEVRFKSRQVWDESWNREGGSAKGMVSGWKMLDVDDVRAD